MGFTKLIKACENGDLIEVKNNFSLEYANRLYDSVCGEHTPFMTAVLYDQYSIIKYLLDKVDVNIINDDGYTALLFAVSRLNYKIDNRQIIWTLIKIPSININITKYINIDYGKCTFLDLLLQNKHFDCYDIIKYSIVQAGAKINSNNDIHASLLIRIVKKNLVKKINKYLMKDCSNIILKYLSIDDYNSILPYISL